jgi:hypothetical protein
MSAFQVFNLETSSPCADNQGVILLFATGNDAAQYARELALLKPGKYQPRPVIDANAPDWRERERAKLASGAYLPLTFAEDVFYIGARQSDQNSRLVSDIVKYNPGLLPVVGIAKDHFAHVALKDSSKLAYTESPEKGARDIQTVMKPGAYLAKYFSSVLSADEITEYARAWQKAYVGCALNFARTPDEIEEIYTSGPSSCMSYRADRYDGDMHPVRVYGAPHSDLTLAYIKGENSITARCLVWETKKLYGRIYGDDTLIARELKTLGFTLGSFRGAKIAKISQDGEGFIMPYIDGFSTVSDSDTYFLLQSGDVDCETTNGVSGRGEVCCCCDSRIDRDDAQSNDNGDMYCDSCYCENYSYCEYYQEPAGSDGFRTVIVSGRHGRYLEQQWSERAVGNHAFECADDGHLYHEDMAVELANGERISQRAYENGDYSHCEETDAIYPGDEMTTLENGDSVSTDWFKDNGFTCDQTGENYRNDELVTMANGDSVCQDWFDDNAFQCVETKANHENSELITMANGDSVCRDWFAENAFTCIASNLNLPLIAAHETPLGDVASWQWLIGCVAERNADSVAA